MDNCSIENCANKAKSLGYCGKHYAQNRRIIMKPEHKAWDNMVHRCRPSYIKPQNYIGRGITVCDEWKHSFKAFYDYIGDKPSPKHSLDRINNDGNYEPGNVRWTDPYTQSANRRLHPKSGHIGVLKHERKNGDCSYSARGYSNKKHILLGNFNNIEDAINKRNDFMATIRNS